MVLARSRLLFAVEYVGGLHVGEATGGGDNHGLRADSARICEEIATGDIFVELVVEHSKTQFRRIVTTVGTTRGEAAVPVAHYLQQYWTSVGWRTRTWIYGEFRITCADYWVVRVSLLSLAAERLERLFAMLEGSRSSEVQKHARVSRSKGVQRALQKTSQDKKYINVVGGPESCAAINTVCLELKRASFSEQDRVSVTPGPLLMATEAQGREVTHMPLDPGSTYPLITTSLRRAYELANAESPDPQLDLGQRSEPRFANHANR